jgi:hypothetical protein
MDMDIVTLIKRKGKQRKKDERNGKGITIGKGNNQTTKRTKDGTKKALSRATLNNWKKNICERVTNTHLCDLARIRDEWISNGTRGSPQVKPRLSKVGLVFRADLLHPFLDISHMPAILHSVV